jgi:hypothetical protein
LNDLKCRSSSSPSRYAELDEAAKSWNGSPRCQAHNALSAAILRAVTPLLTTAANASELRSPRPSDAAITVQRAAMRGCAGRRTATTAKFVCWPADMQMHSAVTTLRVQVGEDLGEVVVHQPVAFAGNLVKAGLRDRFGLVEAIRQGDGVVGFAVPDVDRALDLTDVEAP